MAAVEVNADRLESKLETVFPDATPSEDCDLSNFAMRVCGRAERYPLMPEAARLCEAS
jgi:hypothetical protein